MQKGINMALNFDIVCKFHKVFSLGHNTWIGFEEQCGKMKFGIIHKIDYTFQSNTTLAEYDKKTITNTKQLLERTVHIADKAQRTKAYNELKEDCCIALINFVGANNFMTELKKKYSITHDDFVLGFCGRLVRDKGIIELVEAFKDLKEKYTEKSIKMLIIGEPEKRDGLPERILYYLTHTEGIIFTGRIPFSDIQKYYLLMNVLVLPTHREGFGMVAVEASAMECPAIVSSYTGCAETVIDGKTGLYINQSVSSIVSAIEKCFDKDYAKYLGKNGREFVVNNFEHTLIRKYMLNLINKVIA